MAIKSQAAESIEVLLVTPSITTLKTYFIIYNLKLILSSLRPKLAMQTRTSVRLTAKHHCMSDSYHIALATVSQRLLSPFSFLNED